MLVRNLQKACGQEYDVVIIGGGIFGACALWDATLRGLNALLLEKKDFCGGSSANSFKMIHGGIRYLQHADLLRLWSSCYERSAFLRIAPHLVHPLPILIPTYGHGKSGKPFLATGMFLYDILTFWRNTGIRDRKRRIPWTSLLLKRTVLEHFPDLDPEKLTGGAVFCDGQMYNPTRLALSFIKSAVARGAQALNYAEVTEIIHDGSRVQGVCVLDQASGDEFTVNTRTILNTAGPWVERILNRDSATSLARNTYSRDTCFLVKRRFSNPYALAIQGKTSDPDAILSRPARHLFLVPWRNNTLVGVWHVVYKRDPDDIVVSREELESYLDEINWAYPGMDLALEDITIVNAGLVPFGENEQDAENLSYGKRSHLLDHKELHDIEGLVSLIGIRYTTARGDTAKAMGLIARKLGKNRKNPPTHRIPVYGGDFETFDKLVSEISQEIGDKLNKQQIIGLAHNYGSSYREVLEFANKDTDLQSTVSGTDVLRAEVIHAVEREMAVRLDDVIFRRTDMGTGSNPGKAAITECAGIMAEALNWPESKKQREIEIIMQRFPENCPDNYSYNKPTI